MLKANSKIIFEWKDYPHLMTKAKEKEIKAKIAEKFNVNKSQVEVQRIYLKRNDTGERVSTSILESILDSDKLRKTYLEYLSAQDIKITSEEFFKIDEEVLKNISNSGEAMTNRRYRIRKISGKNIFSYGEFERSYDVDGITLIESNPPNMGGKTSLARMGAFLLYGNKIKYGRKTSITFNDVFNLFTEDNYAFIQGEVEIGNDVYFLKRELKKNKTGNISHSFNIFIADESGEYNEDFGKNALSLNHKDAQATRKKFESVIGTFDDYLFSSYYESQNIEKWLETSETERYRLFCEYLGLGLLDEKHQIAVKMLNSHIKTGLMSKYSVQELEALIAQSKEKISELVKCIADGETAKLDLLSRIENLRQTINNFQSEKLGIDSRITNLKYEELQRKISSIQDKISTKQGEIDTISNEISNFSTELSDFLVKLGKETLDSVELKIVQRIKSTNERISEISFEISEKKSALKVFIPSPKLNEARVAIVKQIDERKAEYKLFTSEKLRLEQELKKPFPKVVCSKCGHEEDGERDRQEYQKQIENLAAKISLLEKEAIRLKEREQIIEKEVQLEAQQESKRITSDIQKLEEDIKVENQKLVEYQEKLQKVSYYKAIPDKIARSTNSKALIEETIQLLTSELREQESLEQLFLNSKSQIEHNNSIDEKITEVEATIKMLHKEISNEEKKISELQSEQKVEEYKISSTADNIKTIQSEIIREANLKAYVQVHSDEGLSKFIIMSILPQINSDLDEILDGTDFKLAIDYNEKGIRFVIEREGRKYNLYQGSGFEKTVSCLALHCVNVRMTNLPISNCLILDEIFGGVSYINLDKIEGILRKLCEVFDNVDLITHTMPEGFRSLADNILRVEKKNNKSALCKAL